MPSTEWLRLDRPGNIGPSLVAVSICTFLVAPALAGPIYSVLPVQSPAGWTQIGVFDINDSGQVAADGNNGTGVQPFIGTVFSSSAVPVPAGWTNTYASGINDAGEISGTGVDGNSISHAFVGTTSGITVVADGAVALGGPNQSGALVGTEFEAMSISTRPLVANTSGTTLLPLIAGGGLQFSYLSINDSGVVAGTVRNLWTIVRRLS